MVPRGALVLGLDAVHGSGMKAPSWFHLLSRLGESLGPSDWGTKSTRAASCCLVLKLGLCGWVEHSCLGTYMPLLVARWPEDNLLSDCGSSFRNGLNHPHQLALMQSAPALSQS